MESIPDPASRTIAAALRRLSEWHPQEVHVEGHAVEAWGPDPETVLVRTERLHLEAEPFASALAEAGLRPQSFVFLSRHKAASGRPSLTVHPVGNFGAAQFGGEAGRLTPAPAALMTELLRALQRAALTAAYPAEVTFEATHHGPFLETPACFLELGSSEAQWTDVAGGGVVARALLEVLARPLPEYPVAVGLGGGHYAPRFTEAALAQRVHFAHLVPAYAAEAASDVSALLEETRQKSPGAQGLYLHRKGLSKDVAERWLAAAQALGWEPLESTAWASA